jgi:Zn-dependent protease with chaperone function
MIEFKAIYFDGRNSKAHAVSLYFDGERIRISGSAGGLPLIFPLAECRLTPPLGKTRRSILLPNGGRCDTHDLQAFRQLENHGGVHHLLRLVNFVESRWRLVAGCVAGLIACVWIFTAHGIPFAAKQIAFSLPPELMEAVSRKTLQALDDGFFEPSTLDAQKADRLQKMFARLVAEEDSDFFYRLALRSSPRAGPNAYALPSGIIVVTDELVALAENDRELIGILVHEAAHVNNRHGLRMLFQNTGVFLLLSVLVGDVASITSIAATLPTLLVESGYSRQFEKEADLAAGIYLAGKGWGTQPLRSLLQRLSENAPGSPVPAAMSTHPELRQRIRYLQDLEASLNR